MEKARGGDSWLPGWMSNTNLRSSEYQKKLKSSGSFVPRTLTSFGFALTLPTDVGCFKFSARPFVRAHPHFAQVRAWHPNHRLMLPVRARPFCECPVRARSFERGPSLRSGPGLTFLTWLNASSPGTNPHFVRIRVNAADRR